MNNNESNASQPNQVTMTFRMICGMYLIYLSYSMIKEASQFTGMWKLLAYFFLCLFAVSGVAIVGVTLKRMKENYFGKQRSEEVDGAEDVDGTGEVYDVKDFGDSEGIEGSENVEVAENIKGGEDMEVTEDIEGSEDMEVAEDIEGSENMEVAEDIEDSEYKR